LIIAIDVFLQRQVEMLKRKSPSILGVLPLLGTWLLCYGFLKSAFDEWQMSRYLDQHGVAADATIVERRGQMRYLAVRYTFDIVTVSGLRRHATWEGTHLLLYLRLRDTSSVRIRYAPSYHWPSRIEGNYNYVVFGIPGIVGAGTMSVATVKFTLYFVRLRDTGSHLSKDGGAPEDG
jgi:hypothetical protein